MTDTVTLASIATPIAGLLGVVVAFLVVRRRFWGRGALDFGVMLGIAIPGTIFGIGYLLAFNTPTEIFGVHRLPQADRRVLPCSVAPSPSPWSSSCALRRVAFARARRRCSRSTPPSRRPRHRSARTRRTRSAGSPCRSSGRPSWPGSSTRSRRAMTAISAVIFLTTPEGAHHDRADPQRGRRGAATATPSRTPCVLIIIVLVAIGILSLPGRDRRTDAEQSSDGGGTTWG